MSSVQQALFMPAPAAGVTYATWNPADKGASITLSGGDLTVSQSGGGGSVRATIGKSSGKWYWEHTTNGLAGCGIGNISMTLNTTPGVGDANGWGYVGDGNVYYNTGSIYSTFATYTSGTVLGLALDMTTGILNIYKNNVLQGNITGLSGTIYPAVGTNQNVGIGTTNFGATAFTYSPPGGFNSGLYV